MMYEEILNNKDYINLVNKIEKMKFITDGKWDWEHGLGHYERVANYVKDILIQLNADERTIELGMVAALLHDIGLSAGEKGDHAVKSSQMFKRFITNITSEEEKILENAIVDHSNGNNINSLVGLALLLGDKLDVTYHRTINSSIQDYINKQIQKIMKVDIEIDDKNLIVKYTVLDGFDIDVFENWEKAITIPRKISKYLNKEYILIINNKEIKIDNKVYDI